MLGGRRRRPRVADAQPARSDANQSPLRLCIIIFFFYLFIPRGGRRRESVGRRRRRLGGALSRRRLCRRDGPAYVVVPEANPWTVAPSLPSTSIFAAPFVPFGGSVSPSSSAPPSPPQPPQAPPPPQHRDHVDLSTRMQLEAFRAKHCTYLALPQLAAAWIALTATQQVRPWELFSCEFWRFLD